MNQNKKKTPVELLDEKLVKIDLSGEEFMNQNKFIQLALAEFNEFGITIIFPDGSSSSVSHIKGIEEYKELKHFLTKKLKEAYKEGGKNG